MDLIVDLDGTLCDISHRVHLAQAGQWDEFHSLLAADQPNLDVVLAVKALTVHHGFIIVSGRSEKYRNQTAAWLARQKLEFDLLLLRPDDNWEQDHILKPKMLMESAYGGNKQLMLENVFAVLDDRDKVVEAWRNLGLPCWQVRNGTY